MKNLTLLLTAVCFSVFSLAAYSQTGTKGNASIAKIAWTKPDSKFITFKPNAAVSAKAVFTVYHSEFGLGAKDEMRLLRTNSDKQGISHYRYQQYYRGCPVDGAVYLLHEKDGKVQSGNGTIVKGLEIPVTVSFLPSQALQAAMSEVPSQKYIWQDTESEKTIKELKNDPNATYYPVPQLVLFDKKFGSQAENYTLAYKIEIYSLQPLARKYVYVDANTGKVIHTINMIQTTDVPATGVTKYNGNQPIVVDSFAAGSYRLRETGRGDGIITRSTQNTEVYTSAIDIVDDNTALFDADDVATAAHWGAEMTYDYYFNVLARNSFDDNGAALLSYVHYGDNYVNAFWDGSKMTYGDGNSQYSAFTALDICGHEITHAVTTYTADLIYQDESGALSEGFSDIFGTCIEFYADTAADWLMGEDIGTPLRSLNDPNQFDNPDTYHGTYWDNDPYGADNGGVHTNCGVANFWFYLLCEGGTGNNDNGDAYYVTALGRAVAEVIAYNTLAYYLTPSSDYYDVYQGSLAAAEALYGPCSNEVYQTANAWEAVGVGFPFDPQEVYILDVLSPVTDCDLHSETVSVRLFYNGCDTLLHASDTISIAYQFDGGAINYEVDTLTSDWYGGDSLIVDFAVPVDATTLGVHTLNCWVKYGPGTTGFTDSIMSYNFYTLQQQNINVGMIKIISPTSQCLLSASEPVTCKFGFYGCDFLPSGTIVDLAYRVNGVDTVIEPYTLTADMYPTDTITYTFTQTFDGTADGNYTIDAWTAYVQDTITANDQYSGYLIKNIGSLGIDTLGFEETNALNYVLIQTTPYSHVNILPTAAGPGSTKGLRMTGGNAMTYIDMLEIPDGFNTWQVNAFLSAKASFCVDATSWNTVYMKFGLKQTHGGELYSLVVGGLPEDYRIASNLRLLANGTQISGTFNPTTPKLDPFIYRVIDLNAYSGTDFILTIETRNIAKDTTIPGLGFKILDNAYVDDVHFFPGPVAVDDTLGININWPAVAHVLDNDNNQGVTTLKTTIITPPLHGTAVVNPDNTISYTPDTSYIGYDTLVYKCCYTTDTMVCDEAYLSLRIYDDMSVPAVDNKFFLTVYPNPFNTVFTVESESQVQSPATITITDVLGRVISETEKIFIPGNNKVYFDLSYEPCGIYCVKVKTSGICKVVKVTRE